MLAQAPAAAALSMLKERAGPPLVPFGHEVPAGAGRAWGAGGRAMAPLLANAVSASPASQNPQLQSPWVGDLLDLSAMARDLLGGLDSQGGAGKGVGALVDDLLGGELGSYLDAALERMTGEIETMFRELGMSAADAANAAAGIGAPAAAQARAGMLSFHAESSEMSASSKVTATGSRQSLSLVMQSIDIAIDPGNGTITISQQRLSVAIEVRTGDQVPGNPLTLDFADAGLGSPGAMGRLFDFDGDGRLDRVAGLLGGGRRAGRAAHGPLRLRLDAVVPLGIDLVDGRLVPAGRSERAEGGLGPVADALLDLTA